MTKSWLMLLGFALGCGGRMVDDPDVQDTAGRLYGGGGATYVTTTIPPALGGATYVTTTIPPALGGATYVTTTVPALGGATTTTGWTTAMGGYITTTTVALGGAVTTAVGTCTSSTNLIAEASSSISGNWIGGDPATTMDNPCGVQGAIYAYSDYGLDNVPGTGDDSVSSPATDPADPYQRLNPCQAGRCCISGITNKWPVNGSMVDYTASVWGGGIGISLNDPGSGATKRPYRGPVKGFVVSTWGTLNGQVLRIAYTQTPYDSDAPFVQFSAIGTYTVRFDAVVCPTWSANCTLGTLYPYDLQIQLIGGDAAGPFLLCIGSITPIL